MEVELQQEASIPEITMIENETPESSFGVSNLVEHKGKQVLWSPDGLFLASYNRNQITIRDRDELNIYAQQVLPDRIDYIEWSPDSSLILCLIKKQNLIIVLSLVDSQEMIQISIGDEGIIHATFTPDSAHVIAFSDFQLRTTIYSLSPLQGYIFPGAKNPKTMITYTEDHKFLILGSREKAKDTISIISTKLWRIILQFNTESINMESIYYSSHTQCLTVVDSPLYYNIYIYSLNGCLLSCINPYNGAMGCRVIQYSPSTPLLALGGHDNSVRIYNTLTWKEQSVHPHDQSALLDNPVVYKEVSKNDMNVMSKANIDEEFKQQLERAPGDTYFYAYRDKVSLQIKQLNPLKQDIKIGINFLSWSPDGRYIASRTDSLPNSVWIWDATRRRLHSILLFKNEVSSVAWCPASLLLSISTNTNMLYIWRPTGICWLQIPEDQFEIKILKWNNDGNALMLANPENYIIAYFN